jgi:hypothetical protein
LAAAILEQNPPDSKRIWVGVLTSSLKLETAANGLLGERLRQLLENGPDDSDLRVRWSRHNEQIRGDDLCDAVLKKRTSATGVPGPRRRVPDAPEPALTPGAPEEVVEHLRRAARGGAGLRARGREACEAAGFTSPRARPARAGQRQGCWPR